MVSRDVHSVDKLFFKKCEKIISIEIKVVFN